jgi:NAD(P)-dependent dehydrogenase (short-subunit alcohol dehydrogenase family)
MKISGTAAIITGGASGLGLATAKELIERGAKVALFDLNTEAVIAAAEQLGALGVTCDVTSGDSVSAAIETAHKQNGAARILVNCAGVGTPGKAVGRDGPLPLEKFEQVIAVNLIGTFNVVRLVAAAMQAEEPPAEGKGMAEGKRMGDGEQMADGERGVIINTASVAAFDGQVGQPAYAASKGGVAAMTLPLAREFAPRGIRVVTIAPGLFETPMLQGLPQDVQDALAADVPFPSRLGQPTEYASLAMEIIGNVMLNGEVIRLDGAIRLKPR